MHTRHIVAALLVAMGVSASSAGAQSPPDAPGISIRVPDSIGSFHLVDRKDYENAEDGFMLRYRRPDGLTGDVFVYPGPDLASGCDMECARRVMEGDVKSFLDVIPELVKRGYVESMTVLTDDTLSPPAGAPWRLGRRMTLRERAEGVVKWSDLYLFYLPRYRVKVRATYAPDSSAAAAIAALAIASPSAFADASHGSGLPSDSTAVTMSVTVTRPGLPATHFRSLLPILAARHYTIADSNPTTGRLTTAPRYEWPEGSEKEKWHGAESPGVRLVLSFTAIGDSTKIVIAGGSPTRAGWTDTAVARQLSLMSVLEVAVAMGGDKPKPEQQGRGTP